MKSKKNSEKDEVYEILSLSPTPVVIMDKDLNIVQINDAVESVAKISADEITGMKCYDFLKTDLCKTEKCLCKRVMEENKIISEEVVSRVTEEEIFYKVTAMPHKNEQGEIIGCAESFFDISEMKKLEETTVKMAKEIMEVASPIVSIFEGILALPIIGTLDSKRTQQIMENLLKQIVETGSKIAIIDITGVTMVDTLVATHLLKTVSAVSLLGAEAIITGIRPEVAQTIVHLGIDLSEIVTRASVAEGLQYGFNKSGIKVIRESK